MKTESTIVFSTKKLKNPIIWGLMLMYSQYNDNLRQQITNEVEKIIEEQMDMIKPKQAKEQAEYWYILVLHNCPFLSKKVIQMIEQKITDIRSVSANPCQPNKKCEEIICDYLDLKSPSGKKPESSFFNWKVPSNFSNQIAYRTYQRTLFRNYKKNKGFDSSLE